MARNLQLAFMMLFAKASLAVWQHVTILEGKTLTLSCPVAKSDRNHVEWTNPRGHVMFFNRRKALKDQRYRVDKLSRSEFTVSVSGVTVDDGGSYTCRHYDDKITERTVAVTVLGRPKMTVTRHGRRTVVKCSAEAKHSPPEIVWELGGIKIAAQPHYRLEEGKSKYLSEETLHVKPLRTTQQIKCIVRHRDQVGKLLMNYVEIGPAPAKRRRKTSIPPQTDPTPEPTAPSRFHRTSSEASAAPHPRPGTTAPRHTASGGPPTGRTSSAHPRSRVAADPTTASHSHHGASSRVSPDRSTTPETSFSTEPHPSPRRVTDETSHQNTSDKSTEGDRTTRSFEGMERQKEKERSGSLLVFLVTCLIFALLVVVIFFAVKLRRAHILWRRENEDSTDQSSDSSKSKSRQEAKESGGLKHRGIFKTIFTKYVSEDPTLVKTVSHAPAAATAEHTKIQVASPTHSGPQTEDVAKEQIKETEL